MIQGAWKSGAGILAVILMTAIAAPASEGKSAATPDFLGPWLNDNNFKLIPAPEGPKPIDDLDGYVHHERGVDANGNDFSTNAYIGNYKSPLLTPWGSANMQKQAENAIKGLDPFWPATFCYPFGPTVLLQPEPVAFLQTAKEITIEYQRDHQVRRVYLNVPHSKNPKPSWYGESVGHYEGDTLVVDTIGFNGKAFVDRYGTPYSDRLHMIERYRVSADGKSLQAEVTYDDPKAYSTEWKALIKYHRGPDLPVEVACPESAIDPVTGKIYEIPIAEKPDF